MTQITINLPNEAEAQWLVELLNRLQVPFEVEADELPLQKGDKTINPENLFGIWQKEPRTLKEIRIKAWPKRTKVQS
ncbi:MAG TPA: hypothetical protein DCM71_15565 [Runella sp.]|nr:hypothetical protein [Runella sp.]